MSRAAAVVAGLLALLVASVPPARGDWVGSSARPGPPRVESSAPRWRSPRTARSPSGTTATTWCTSSAGTMRAVANSSTGSQAPTGHGSATTSRSAGPKRVCSWEHRSTMALGRYSWLSEEPKETGFPGGLPFQGLARAMRPVHRSRSRGDPGDRGAGRGQPARTGSTSAARAAGGWSRCRAGPARRAELGQSLALSGRTLVMGAPSPSATAVPRGCSVCP